MSTTIHIVSTNYKNQSGTDTWFWDRDEAQQVYNRKVEEVGDTNSVQLLRLDVNEAMSEIVAEAISNESAEVLDSHEPDAEEAVWGELEFRPEGYFYIERTKASTSEYWPYRVERYAALEDGAWRVIDATMGTPVGIIRPGTQNESFKVVVNGYSQTGVFINLKEAVIFAATEFNG